MSDPFLAQWFGGFEVALQNMSEEERAALLRPCAKACSESYPANIFREAFSKSSDRADFLHRIESGMGGVVIERVDASHVVFVYPECYCDLHTRGWVSTPELCECSRYNLQANFEAAMGPSSVTVELEQTILGGAESCRLRVSFLD
ncbi:MAG: hypothetical protein GXY06_06240 [Clostridiaceae bacterium]|nr:hypothetical protein [Clostridiaceae bacterium]